MVNDMLDQPGPVREGEQLDAARLQQYLSAHLEDSNTTWSVEQFPSGYSNLTYLLDNGARQLVLRRPPFGNQVKSAHDMGREYRILSKLCCHYQAAPQPLLYCQDSTVIGDEFYVMERCHGVILRGPKPPPQLASDARLARRLCESFIDNLARLHTLDFQAAGLADLGKPDGYVDRQVEGWTKRYAKAQTSDEPQIDQLASWLHQNRPNSTRAALIHNDYKYDNLMLDSADITRVVAVLDWEMSTLGDPFMDLGTALAYWIEPADAPSLQALAFGPTMTPGSLSRASLLNRYCEQTGWDVHRPLFYYCFGLFKLAVIVQQIYARYVRGHTKDSRFSELDRSVACLGQAAVKAIESGGISPA